MKTAKVGYIWSAKRVVIDIAWWSCTYQISAENACASTSEVKGLFLVKKARRDQKNQRVRHIKSKTVCKEGPGSTYSLPSDTGRRARDQSGSAGEAE